MKSSVKILVMVFLLFFTFCKKEEKETESTGLFKLSSSEISSDSLLPSDYTCDGQSATLPLKWENPPSNTVTFTIIMHHEAAPDDIHWYWILYNIPSNILELEKNVTGIGQLGTNSVNDKNEYSPPCSQGPGIKAYTFTLYALSEELNITVAPENIDRDFMLNEMTNKIISTAKMTVYYSRQIK